MPGTLFFSVPPTTNAVQLAPETNASLFGEEAATRRTMAAKQRAHDAKLEPRRFTVDGTPFRFVESQRASIAEAQTRSDYTRSRPERTRRMRCGVCGSERLWADDDESCNCGRGGGGVLADAAVAARAALRARAERSIAASERDALSFSLESISEISGPSSEASSKPLHDYAAWSSTKSFHSDDWSSLQYVTCRCYCYCYYYYYAATTTTILLLLL